MASNFQDETPDLDYVDLSIDGQYVRLNWNNPTTIEMPTLNSENDILITVTETDVYDVYFDNNLLTPEGLTYRFEALDPNITVPIRMVRCDSGIETNYTLKTWPSQIPSYTVVGESPYEGDYYLTKMGDGGDNVAMKIDRWGRLKYYYYNAYGAIADFKKVETPDGVRYLMFTTIATPHTTKGLSQSGCYVVYDEQYHEIQRLYMKQSEHVPSENYPVDQHDCLYLSDNEYYLISYVDKNVYNIPDTVPHKENGTLVSAAVIQGIKNGEIIFEWDSTDYPELYELSVDFNDFTNQTSIYAADYMHINSIALDPKDGNLIASFRNIDSIIKINLADSSIMWKLSGKGDDFGLDASQKTSRQHYAHYTDEGTILVFDNGNANQQTRIVEYQLDEETLKLESFISHQIDGYFSSATGSVQKLDTEKDVYMIGWGTRTVNNSNYLYPQFSEIDFTTGETLFEFRFINSALNTYRCVKYK